MASCRVALLQCDHVAAHLRHVAGDYDDMFAALFGAVAPELALDRIDVVGGQPLPAVGAHDAVLVSGSRHSVHDDLDWVVRLRGHVRAAVDAGVPLIGICFGHQLLASALGGFVERAAAGWGVGVHAARVVATRPWMQPPADEFRLLVSHQDQVVAPPPDATVVAAGHHTPVAAFEVGSAVGFQGHPEFVPAYADELMSARVDHIGADLVARARATLSTPTEDRLVATWLTNALTGRR